MKMAKNNFLIKSILFIMSMLISHRVYTYDNFVTISAEYYRTEYKIGVKLKFINNLRLITTPEKNYHASGNRKC
jgi:hypothetical protein